MAIPHYNQPNVKQHMGTSDLHFTFNLHKANRRLKCFDYSGRMIWQAFASRNQMCKQVKFPSHSSLGSVNLLHHNNVTEAWDKTIYLSHCDLSFGWCPEIDGSARWGNFDLCFTEKGLWVDVWTEHQTPFDVDIFDLEPADFAQLKMFVDGGRKCFLVVHYYE
ncbi:MAG: hypothetical protein JNL98_24705 [Bryobacterales bacterium]|nr:hypothetical protein [Bryobacterales bacterium]